MGQTISVVPSLPGSDSPETEAFVKTCFPKHFFVTAIMMSEVRALYTHKAPAIPLNYNPGAWIK